MYPKLGKDLGMFILPILQLSAGCVPSYMYAYHGLSGNLLPVLVSIVNSRYISFRVVMGYTMLECRTGRIGVVFFDPTFQTSARLPNVRRIAVFLRVGPLINQILAQLCRDFVFRMHEQGFQVLHPLKIIWTLVSLNILQNSSPSPWKYRTETKASLVVSWVKLDLRPAIGFFSQESQGNSACTKSCLSSPSA